MWSVDDFYLIASQSCDFLQRNEKLQSAKCLLLFYLEIVLAKCPAFATFERENITDSPTRLILSYQQ